jgi:hypothetical protein|nr:MAG TPA: hypothetical protein [Caudoviricetes sp.]
MTTQELKDIVRESQLELISDEKKYDTYITGFKSLDQAREFADKYERNLYLIDVQPNADFYTEAYPRTEKIDTSWLRSIFVDEEIEEVKKQFCQGAYIYFDNSHVEDFQQVDIDETVEWMREEEKNEKEIEEFLSEMNGIKKQIEGLADNEIIVKYTNDDRFFKVLARCEKDYFNEKTNTLTRIAVGL